MHLLKVIVACAAATANLFTGMLCDMSCEDPSAGRYAEAQKEKEAFTMDMMIQNTASTVLAQHGDKSESGLAQRPLDAYGASDEEMQDSPETALGDDGREVADAKSTGDVGKAADTDKAKSAQKQDGAGSAAEKGSVEDGAGKALASAGDTYGSVPASAASSSNAPAGIADSKPTSAAANSASSTQPASAASAPASAVGQQASPATESAPATAAPSATAAPEAAAPKPDKNYDHTTSIYSDGYEALLRVEYYDENNKLFEYSSVSDYDKDTNSYTETVYRWDDETDSQVTMRTDTYVNGELVSSESP